MFYITKTLKITLAGTRKICFCDDSKNVMDARFISSRPERKPNESSRQGKVAAAHGEGWQSRTSVVTRGHNTDLHGVCPCSPFSSPPMGSPHTYKPRTHKTVSLAIRCGISLANWCNQVNQGVLSTLKFHEINFSLIMCACPIPFWIAQWLVFSASFGLEAVWWGHAKSGTYSISSGCFYVCPRGDCI